MGRQIGKVCLGYTYYVVKVESTGQGGESYMGVNPTILVRLEDDWNGVVSTCWHEMIEQLFVQYHVRYQKIDETISSPCQVMFQFDHNVFTSIVDEAARAFNDIETPLRKAWQNAKK